ncbi:MAG: DUF1016 family protein [Bacteroidaceae bacterium]|nr:DUF1016 family protein [Bacteroidaceae bacterium]
MATIQDVKTLFDNQDYGDWLKELKQRYLAARLRASLSVTKEVLRFYWSVGRDIASKQWTNTYGSAFYKTLSRDMRREIPNVEGFSETNLKYMYYFYLLYHIRIENHLRSVDDSIATNHLQSVDESSQLSFLKHADVLTLDVLCSIPWFHHQRIIDKCKGDVDKAIFYVCNTIQYNWGRDMLLNFLGSNLYEREGKAINNFRTTLPAVQGDLAKQITRDPYNFDFLTMTVGYREKELEDALVTNVTRFLLELGAGWAYMGRQIRLGVGEKEIFPDLLFYNTKIHAYCVVELKVGSFKAEYLGQLSLYVATINHQMKSETDNPTIGLLICRDKDNVMAQYALENISAPIGISEYQLSQLYPSDFKSSLPSVEEVERELSRSMTGKLGDD